MVRSLLWRGLLVGLLGALVAFALAQRFGEPQVEGAVTFEASRDAARGAAGDPELVSRAAQGSAGLLVGLCIYGLALGGIFALAFAAAHGRVARVRPRATAALLAIAGFLAFVVVPMAKYPANPPGIGSEETIGRRDQIYLALIVISVAGVVAAYRVARGLLRRWDPWNAVVAAVAVYVTIVGGAQAALPSASETPEGFPADVLWQFRTASLAIQAVLWVTVGLGFGALAERALAARAHRPPAA